MRVRFTVIDAEVGYRPHIGVGSEGKPVQSVRTRHWTGRCPPAAASMSPQPLEPPAGPGKAREGDPREPGDLPPTTSRYAPRGEGWLSVAQRRFTGPFAAGLLVSPRLHGARAGAANVTFRVEGASGTLVSETALQTPPAAFAKDAPTPCRAPPCTARWRPGPPPRWSGTYFSGFGDYSVTTIKGETYDFSTPDFWAFTVNNKEIFTGPCNTPAQDGDEIIYFVSRCEFGPPPDFACQNPPVRPLGLLDVPQAANKASPSPSAWYPTTATDASRRRRDGHRAAG